MTKPVRLRKSWRSGSKAPLTPYRLAPSPQMKNNNRGIAPLLVVAYIAVAGVLGFIAFKPKFLDKASKTAAASTVATANVNTAHEEEVKALKAKSASAAAGVAVVNQVAGTLPDSEQFLLDCGGLDSVCLHSEPRRHCAQFLVHLLSFRRGTELSMVSFVQSRGK